MNEHFAVVRTIDAVRQHVQAARDRKEAVGLVPTMGALHAGHISLIHAARAETDYVVVSIFVNPTQFGPHEDFERYPRPLEKDLEICRVEGVHLVFAPAVTELYPAGFCSYVEVHGLQDVLCGAARPGHFRGVATVVLKLFHIVQPDVAYFGQKDAQQARIIQQMVRDLDVPVRLRVCPIVREPDGLALSSRNQYLNADERLRARVLHEALAEVRRRVEAGERDAACLRHLILQRLADTPGALVDYAAIVDADTLQPIDRLHGKVLVALAVRFGGTRLIDNVVLEVPPDS
jgi:pantoate--beta-alanine ligase